MLISLSMNKVFHLSIRGENPDAPREKSTERRNIHLELPILFILPIIITPSYQNPPNVK